MMLFVRMDVLARTYNSATKQSQWRKNTNEWRKKKICLLPK